MRTAIAAAALVCLMFSGIASADALYPNALTFGPLYASGPPQGFPWYNLPHFGDTVTIIGTVTGASNPFTDLLPAGPYEMTCVFEGGTCYQAGNWDDLECSNGGLYAAYQGGTLSIYLDTTPDADFAAPATFRDGELVLQAAVTDLHAADDDPPLPCGPDNPDVTSVFSFTGGTWFSRVNSHGVGLQGAFEGEINSPGNVPADLQALGYVLRVDGTINIFGPVATQPVTWGHVKSLFR